MTKRPEQSAAPEAETAPQTEEQQQPTTQQPAPAAARAEHGGKALYGLARGLTGQKLTDAWNAVPAGLRAPYIERAQTVLDAAD